LEFLRIHGNLEQSVKKILIIGIGAGDPEYVTVQAINAMNRADVFFVMDKGVSKAKLVQVRKEIIERYVKERDYRIVEATSPERQRDVASYVDAVETLNHEKQVVFECLIEEELRDGECGAFLVWGDPSLYDSTVRIVERILARGELSFGWDVVPGVSAVSLLAARHRVVLHGVGEPVTITTGRRLHEEVAAGRDNLVVMLDGSLTCGRLDPDAWDIWWGANLGTTDEALWAGRLGDVLPELAQARRRAREARGWVMDTYLLRRR
jgi:precorrin-6A synthase